jgi:H+/Cl- antiporter ClcA
VLAAVYIRLIGWLSHQRITGIKAIFAPLVAFGIVGLIGLAYPQLFGNGKDIAHDVFRGLGGFPLLLGLFLLKPLVTALCLGSGASGGLFTPVMSSGALLGGLLGVAWIQLWPGSPVGAYAMVGAAAMIAAIGFAISPAAAAARPSRLPLARTPAARPWRTPAWPAHPSPSHRRLGQP